MLGVCSTRAQPMAARVLSIGKAAVDERAASAFAAGLLRWKEAGQDNEAAVAPVRIRHPWPDRPFGSNP